VCPAAAALRKLRCDALIDIARRAGIVRGRLIFGNSNPAHGIR
jgi:hypothetical protein